MVAKGLRFAYHIHGYEFQPLNCTRGIDVLLDELIPAYVELQVDTFWVASSGLNIIEFSETTIERIGSFHIKDAASLDPLLDIEVGEGILDISGIVRLGMEHGVEWFIVEQETTNRKMLDSIKTSQNNLRAMISNTQ